jgi:hypothetical protein
MLEEIIRQATGNGMIGLGLSPSSRLGANPANAQI